MREYGERYEQLALLIDYVIGNIDTARNVVAQGDDSDVPKSHLYNSLWGSVEQLMAARKIVDDMLEIHDNQIKVIQHDAGKVKQGEIR